MVDIMEMQERHNPIVIQMKIMVVFTILMLLMELGRCTLIATTTTSTTGEEVTVTYDGRSLIVGGQRKILFSGSIHYPRSTPQMWPSLIAKAKEGGIDVIQTYVFWNLHELRPGQYDFTGRHDLVKFIKEIQAQGLYVCLRIGPYIESEWAYGGFPFWLHDIPDIVFRSDNEPFKYYMQNFTSKIVGMMKSEGLYASQGQGGPIILSQIENEYQNIEASFHEKGPSYVVWAANMAVGLQTDVPWVMCKQSDAPDPVINTCNGMRCGETFAGPNSPNKPSMWTENWTSFYQVYGGEPYLRSAEDIAFHVALFISKGGSYVNYYMYHGGTNFGRKASAYVTASYYDQAPIDEYGLLRQPKWGHLKELHTTIKNCSRTILEGLHSNFSLGPLQEAYSFQEETGEGGCVAFLLNNNSRDFADVEFQNRSFKLPPKSISILPDCSTIAFNTANVTTESNERSAEPKVIFDSADEWEAFSDVILSFAETSLKAEQLLEHMNTAKDQSDYLWYTFRLEADSSPCTHEPVLRATSLAHVAYAFVNGDFAGGAHGNHVAKNFTLETPITLLDDRANNITILSVMTGLPDSGAFMEKKYAGLTHVEIRCSDNVSYDVSNSSWGYQVGLLGESLQIYQEENTGKVEWIGFQQRQQQPFTWFKTKFDATILGVEVGPENDGEVAEAVALNLASMGKGEAWVNGESIGRYWVSFRTPKGLPSQTLYHVPLSLLKPSENVLVLLEEEVAVDPLGVSLNIVSTTPAPNR